MAALDEILGQAPAVETLRNALAAGRLHHAYRFEGPRGVGKELTALALAQTLLCRTQTGCGECSACRRARTFSETPPHVPLHPDVIVLGRGLYSGTLLSAKEANGISVEQVRKLVLGRVGYPPHEGAAIVVMVRDADELTISAANALLKTLEEPRERVHFILLTHRPNRLLDTVRSRTLALRFGPLPDAVIIEILHRHGKPSDSFALAEGSAAVALHLADAEERDGLSAFAEGISSAVRSPTLVAALDMAGNLPRDKQELQALLLSYAQQIALKNRELVRTEPQQALRATFHYEAVQQAVVALEHNAAPSLVFEAMLTELRQSGPLS